MTLSLTRSFEYHFNFQISNFNGEKNCQSEKQQKIFFEKVSGKSPGSFPESLPIWVKLDNKNNFVTPSEIRLMIRVTFRCQRRKRSISTDIESERKFNNL